VYNLGFDDEFIPAPAGDVAVDIPVEVEVEVPPDDTHMLPVLGPAAGDGLVASSWSTDMGDRREEDAAEPAPLLVCIVEVEAAAMLLLVANWRLRSSESPGMLKRYSSSKS